MCEDIRTVCPVAVESESSVAPIENVVGAAVGVAVGSCGLVFLFLYIMVYREKYRRRRRRARNRNLAMARRGHDVARGLDAVADSDAAHRELQSQGGAAGPLLLKQLDKALHFLPTSEYGARARAAGGALERADMPANKRAEGQTGGTAAGPSNEEDESMCSICLNDYEDDKMCSTLPCGHVFHRACITQWLRCGRLAGAECPLCKEPILQGALWTQVDAALGGRPLDDSQRRPRLSPEDDIDEWAGPSAQDMDEMRAEAATGMTERSEREFSGQLEDDIELARRPSTTLERMEAELERSTWHRPPPPRAPVARQQAFRIRGDAAGPILVSNLDPDLVADLRATGLSMEEICVQLGIEP